MYAHPGALDRLRQAVLELGRALAAALARRGKGAVDRLLDVLDVLGKPLADRVEIAADGILDRGALASQRFDQPVERAGGGFQIAARPFGALHRRIDRAHAVGEAGAETIGGGLDALHRGVDRAGEILGLATQCQQCLLGSAVAILRGRIEPVELLREPRRHAGEFSRTLAQDNAAPQQQGRPEDKKRQQSLARPGQSADAGAAELGEYHDGAEDDPANREHRPGKIATPRSVSSQNRFLSTTGRESLIRFGAAIDGARPESRQRAAFIESRVSCGCSTIIM